MNLKSALCALPLAFLFAACAVEATDDPTAAPSAEELSKTKTGVSLENADDGATFTVEAGKKITVTLTYGGFVASPFGKYEVTSTSKTLGNPRITNKAPKFPDAPMTEVLEWSTTHAIGTSTVVLSAKSLKGGEPRTFTFTVNVIAPKSKGAKAGAMCGGIAGIACGDGLNCVMDKPSYPDQAGTCEKPHTGAGLGETCAGFAGIRCEEGLECVDIGKFPDAPGKCAASGN